MADISIALPHVAGPTENADGQVMLSAYIEHLQKMLATAGQDVVVVIEHCGTPTPPAASSLESAPPSYDQAAGTYGWQDRSVSPVELFLHINVV